MIWYWSRLVCIVRLLFFKSPWIVFPFEAALRWSIHFVYTYLGINPLRSMVPTSRKTDMIGIHACFSFACDRRLLTSLSGDWKYLIQTYVTPIHGVGRMWHAWLMWHVWSHTLFLPAFSWFYMGWWYEIQRLPFCLSQKYLNSITASLWIAKQFQTLNSDSGLMGLRQFRDCFFQVQHWHA